MAVGSALRRRQALRSALISVLAGFPRLLGRRRGTQVHNSDQRKLPSLCGVAGRETARKISTDLRIAAENPASLPSALPRYFVTCATGGSD